MSLSSKLTDFKSKEWSNFEGRIEFINKVKITPEADKPDYYFITNKEAINEDFIYPVSDNNSPDSSADRFKFLIKKGADIELHYKNLTHSFKWDFGQGEGFVLDMDNIKIIPFSAVLMEEHVNQCYFWATPWNAKCCETSVIPHKRGIPAITCGMEFRDDRCCDGGRLVDENVKTQHDEI